jgi:hypothetical protein
MESVRQSGEESSGRGPVEGTVAPLQREGRGKADEEVWLTESRERVALRRGRGKESSAPLRERLVERWVVGGGSSRWRCK